MMDMKSILFSLAIFVTIATCEDLSNQKSLSKRSVGEEAEAIEPIDALATEELDEGMDKRRLMRYGRGALMRYGRGALMRYGKRGGLMRYGKRADDEEEDTDFDVDSAKRLFRYGKRSDDDEADEYKRLFRWGKRDGESVFEDEKRGALMRYGKRSDDEKRRIFRYGKRAGDDLQDLVEEEKRRLMRYGKREDPLFEEAKRRLMRYGRDIEIRAPAQPHVPFRFGEKEE